MISAWLHNSGKAIAVEVNRLWPEEDNPAHRAQCLSEEAGEVSRAITKRRHALNSSKGTCKGLTVEEWTGELTIELAQTLGVVLDIAYRENIDLFTALENVIATLQEREEGS